jgi:hypothetical protein
MDGGRMDEDGFFMGLVAGDLGGTPTYRRFGAGGDLGYQLVRKYTRWTASAGLVMLNHDPKRNSPNEPGIVLAVSVSLRK